MTYKGGGEIGSGRRKCILKPECEAGIKSVPSAQVEEEVNDVGSQG